MEKMLDLRGLSCPIPLIQTKNALAEATAVTVIVDEAVARENIMKFAKARLYQADCRISGGDYIITICK
jgi:tRNA 2-thiouridine synthesizing protein A